MAKEVVLGIVSYNGVPPEVLEDYMKFAFYLGRRCQEYDFGLVVRSRREQYRSRNAIVTDFLGRNSEYLLMLDDDHIIDIHRSMEEKTLVPSGRYNFVGKLVKFLEEDPIRGIVGALYYQRGGAYAPVMMHEREGQYFFLEHLEVAHRPQLVDVTGGGCMLLRRELFDRIPSPWFRSETDAGVGTDVQICKAARENGFQVWCDTSIEIGHIRAKKTVITSRTIASAEAEEELYASDLDD